MKKCEALKNMIGTGIKECGAPADVQTKDGWICAECYQTDLDNLEGIPLRDWLAAHETLSEWEDFDALDQSACELLAGRPKPKHGWRCETREQLIETLQWEADWRAILKYILADAMLKARVR